MPVSPVARRTLQGAGAGLAAGLFNGYRTDNGGESSGLGHYARNALGGAAIGAGVGAGVGAVQRLGAGMRRAPIYAQARVVSSVPTGQAPALNAINPVQRAPLQLPASTGYDVAARGVVPTPPSGNSPISMGPMGQLNLPPQQRARNQRPYTVGPAQITPQMRADERYTMGTANRVPRVDEAYKLGAHRASHLFGL